MMQLFRRFKLWRLNLRLDSLISREAALRGSLTWTTLCFEARCDERNEYAAKHNLKPHPNTTPWPRIDDSTNTDQDVHPEHVVPTSTR